MATVSIEDSTIGTLHYCTFVIMSRCVFAQHSLVFFASEA